MTAPGQAIIRAARGDRDALRELTLLVAGDRAAKSLSELAKWFGVSVATVKTGWRRAGDMPGKEGHWPLAEIVFWKLDRDIVPTSEDEKEPGPKTALNRKREADARKAEADAAAKELKNELAAGNLLYRDDVEREISEHILVVRHTLERLPATMTPRFPKKIAGELAEQLRVEIEAALAYLADLPASAIPRVMDPEE